MSAYEPYPTRAATAESAASPVETAPHDDANTFELASRWRRFFALLVDSAIVFLLMLPVIGGLAEYVDIDTETLASTFLFAALALCVWGLYTVPMLARDGRHNGQTLGKQLLRVRVMTTEGVPVTAVRALRREILGNMLPRLVTAPFYSFYSWVDYLFALFDGKRQTLHDKIASTCVVRVYAAPPPAPPAVTPPPAAIVPPAPAVPPAATVPPAAPAPPFSERPEAPAQVWLPPTAPRRAER